MLVGAGVYVSPFAWDTGSVARDPVPVDAIPDLGDNQQIVFTNWPGRSPRDVEDQITYPLTTALIGIPGVRTVRSSSAFGFSTIYVIFDDDVEFYWSRARVLEKLASLSPGTVPEGVTPTLGPDATALGQIFWYTLEGRDAHGNTVGGWDPDELRSIQDWSVRYALQAVEGVSEVASVGGFVREYQVDVDPEAMRAHGISLAQVAGAVRNSNLDVGARTLEINRVEYVVRGRGFVEGIEDLESTVIDLRDHTPIRIRDVGHVALGPSLRRGALDDAGAPAVGGVVVARYRENPLAVISAVREKIAEIEPGLPRRELEDGTVSQVSIVPFYDRSSLIHETLGTLETALYQEVLITIIVVLIMLRNLRSSLLISAMLPLGVLATFVLMKAFGVDANIMALAGIAIAIGTMVDIGIVFVENIEQQLRVYAETQPRGEVVRRAAAEVAPAVLTSVLTTVVSFVPVFGLSAGELRLFGPLAYTKTFAMLAALVLALIVLPGAALLVLRKRPTAPVRRPGESATGHILRSMLRVEHVRDWLLFGLGMWLLGLSPLAGAFVAILGLARLARPFLVSTLIRSLGVCESTVAVIAVTVLLATNWLPLGPASTAANTVFVGGILVLVLGSFRVFEWLYPWILAALLRNKLAFLALPTFVVVFGLTAWLGFPRVFGFLPDGAHQHPKVQALSQALPGLGREYMPAFDEGSYLYMPTTMPHASIGAVLDMLSDMDAAIAEIPEVDRVVGKLGRVDSALDPAPVSMIETVISYKPEYRVENGQRIRQWRDQIRSPEDIWREIVRAGERPGLTSAPTLMPINARLVMLQSGMRAPMGIKVHGPSLEAIEAFGLQLEAVLKRVPEVRPQTVFADRVVGKPYLEIELNREAIGRYGLSIVDVQQVLQVALGGMTLTRTVEGRERYGVRVRYMREERDSIEALGQIFVPTQSGEQVPLRQLADIQYVRGPQLIKSEDTFLTSYVLFDRRGEVPEFEAVEHAREAIEHAIKSGVVAVPDGVSYTFAGSYERQVRTEQRLLILIPIALGCVLILLYLQFRRLSTVVVIYTGVAVSVAGGMILVWLYGQPWFLDSVVLGTSMRELFRVETVHLSVAVWIGLIALVGIATDDGVVMSTYLDQQFRGLTPKTVVEVRTRVVEAGTRRVRPCLMTTATTILALLPVITSQGRGADIMLPMALPAVGGMAIEVMTLFVVPVLYCGLEEWRLRRQALPAADEPSSTAD